MEKLCESRQHFLARCWQLAERGETKRARDLFERHLLADRSIDLHVAYAKFAEAFCPLEVTQIIWERVLERALHERLISLQLESCRQIALLLQQQNRFFEARQYQQRAIALSLKTGSEPGIDPETLLVQANELWQTGETEPAIFLLKSLCSYDNQVGRRAKLTLARLCHQEADIDSAVHLVEDVLHESSSTGDSRLSLAALLTQSEIFRTQGRLMKAKESLKEAIRVAQHAPQCARELPQLELAYASLSRQHAVLTHPVEWN